MEVKVTVELVRTIGVAVLSFNPAADVGNCCSSSEDLCVLL
jgi:hypothetical protein